MPGTVATIAPTLKKLCPTSSILAPVTARSYESETRPITTGKIQNPVDFTPPPLRGAVFRAGK